MFSKIQIHREVYGSEEHQMVRQALNDFIEKEAIPFQEEWEKQNVRPNRFGVRWESRGFCVWIFLRNMAVAVGTFHSML